MATTTQLRSSIHACSYYFFRKAQCAVTSRIQHHILYPCERGPTTECRPTPHFGLNFLLRSSVYSNMRPCVAALENPAQMAGL